MSRRTNTDVSIWATHTVPRKPATRFEYPCATSSLSVLASSFSETADHPQIRELSKMNAGRRGRQGRTERRYVERRMQDVEKQSRRKRGINVGRVRSYVRTTLTRRVAWATSTTAAQTSSQINLYGAKRAHRNAVPGQRPRQTKQRRERHAPKYV